MNENTLAGQRAWPGVSVVLPVRNEVSSLCDALRSVVAQAYPGPMEVIVADGSDDSAPVLRAIRDFAGVRVVRNREGSAAAGLNVAIRAAVHPVVARCDARCTLPPGYIQKAVETMLRTRAVNVGGRQFPVGTTPFERAVAMAMSGLAGSGGARYRRKGPEGSTDTVFLGVFQRAAVLEAGGFDTSLQRNQDYELNWRLRQLGGTVWFDPELAVSYRPRSTPGALARQYFDYGLWKRVMLRRSPASLRLRQAIPPLATLGLVLSGLLGLIGALTGCSDALLAALVVPGSYVAVLMAGTASAFLGSRQPEALLVPIALATMHLGWGTGFLFGRVTGWVHPRPVEGADRKRRFDRT